MTLFKEVITLNYLLTKMLQQSKIAVTHVKEFEFSNWLSAWNRVKELKDGIYAVAYQIDIDHYGKGYEAMKRVTEMNHIFYLLDDGNNHQQATLALIDLMLDLDRINETVQYIIHGDI